MQDPPARPSDSAFEPDLAGLEKLARRGDREEALFFVGRNDIIRMILGRAQRAIEERQADSETRAEGATHVLAGAPGAGKTATLSEIRNRCLASKGNAPIVVELDVSELGDARHVALKIADAIPGNRLLKLLRKLFRGAAVKLDLKLLQVSQNWEHPEDHPQARKMDRLSTRLFASLLPRKCDRPVLVFVDEIQDVELVGRTALQVLRPLHLGVRAAPIVPVYAGLSHARKALLNIGLTRLDSRCVHMMGPLEDGEAAEAAERVFDSCHVRCTEAERRSWTARIERLSDKWPQHLHNALATLAQCLHEAKGILGDVNLEAFEARESAIRTETYRERTQDGLEVPRKLVASLMAAVGSDGLPLSDLIDKARELASRRGDPASLGAAWELPEGMSEEDFIDHMIRKGALHEGGNGRYVCPIPSFRSHLLAQGDLDPAMLQEARGASPRQPPGGSPRTEGIQTPLTDGGKPRTPA